jgi:hypothetical protein
VDNWRSYSVTNEKSFLNAFKGKETLAGGVAGWISSRFNRLLIFSGNKAVKQQSY